MKIMKLIDRIPLLPLMFMAFILGFAPFLPQPHLVQKLTLLFDGRLNNAMDFFDLFLHGILPCLLVIKLVRTKTASKGKSPQEP